MKRVIAVLAILIIVASAAVIIWAKRGSTVPFQNLEADDDIMRFVSERAMPPMVKRAASQCRVPNPAADLIVSLTIVFDTTEHGVTIVSAEPMGIDGGGPPNGADCVAENLVKQHWEDQITVLPVGRQYGLEVDVPLPASGASY